MHEKQKVDIQPLGEETCYFCKNNCITDEKAENFTVTREVLLFCCQERLKEQPRARGAPLANFWWSSQLSKIPQERCKELISKAYFDVEGPKLL